MDMRPALPRRMRTPLTVVYAVNAYATEARFGALMRAGYAAAPEVRFIAVEPSYHFIMLDQPARFQAVLTDFLAERRPLVPALAAPELRFGSATNLLWLAGLPIGDWREERGMSW